MHLAWVRPRRPSWGIQAPQHPTASCLSNPSRMSCWKSIVTRRKHLYLKAAVCAFISLNIFFQSLVLNVVCHQQCHEKSREKNVVCAISSPQAIKLLFQTVSKHCKIQEGRANWQSRCLNSHCFWLHNARALLHTHTHTHTHTCACMCTMHSHTDTVHTHTHKPQGLTCVHTWHACTHTTHSIHTYRHVHVRVCTSYDCLHVYTCHTCTHMYGHMCARQPYAIHVHTYTHMYGHTIQTHIPYTGTHTYHIHMHACTHIPHTYTHHTCTNIPTSKIIIWT